MAQVSSRVLEKETQRRIDRQLLTFLKSGSQSADIFGELLTDTERLMLAKRLATILLLIDEQSYYRIEQSLGISTSTSKRLHSLLISGAFSSLERLMKRKRDRKELIEDIARIISLGLPPYAYVIKKRRAR